MVVAGGIDQHGLERVVHAEHGGFVAVDLGAEIAGPEDLVQHDDARTVAWTSNEVVFFCEMIVSGRRDGAARRARGGCRQCRFFGELGIVCAAAKGFPSPVRRVFTKPATFVIDPESIVKNARGQTVGLSLDIEIRRSSRASTRGPSRLDRFLDRGNSGH